MASELNKMKGYALSRGLCGEYAAKWGGAGSKEELVRTALDANGAGFLCEGCAAGWGLTPGYLLREFGPWVNGRYKADYGKYTTSLWVRCQEEGVSEMNIDTTLTLLVDCRCTVHVPQGRIRRLYVAKGDVRIDCDGILLLSVYGDEAKVSVTGDGRCVRRDIAIPTDGSILNVGERNRGVPR